MYSRPMSLSGKDVVSPLTVLRAGNPAVRMRHSILACAEKLLVRARVQLGSELQGSQVPLPLVSSPPYALGTLVWSSPHPRFCRVFASASISTNKNSFVGICRSKPSLFRQNARFRSASLILSVGAYATNKSTASHFRAKSKRIDISRSTVNP